MKKYIIIILLFILTAFQIKAQELKPNYTIGIGLNSADPYHSLISNIYLTPQDNPYQRGYLELDYRTYGIEIRRYDKSNKSFLFLRGSYLEIKNKKYRQDQFYSYIFSGIAKNKKIKSSNIFFNYGVGGVAVFFNKDLEEAFIETTNKYFVNRYGIRTLLSLQYDFRKFSINTNCTFFTGLEVQKNDAIGFENVIFYKWKGITIDSFLGLNINYKL